MPLPELRNWTLVRLYYAARDRVVQCVVATGHVFNRIHTYDGQLLMTTRLKDIRSGDNLVETLNTVYMLSGSPCPLEAWDDERFDWTWQRANYDLQCLSQIDGVTLPTDALVGEINDPGVVRLHNAQTSLLAVINIATDIDNGLGRLHSTPDTSLLGALGIIAGRTANVDAAVRLAHQGRKTLIQECGGIIPADECSDFPPSLMLLEGGEKGVPRRLIPVAKAAGLVATELPERLGPWARCAWFLMKNPNIEGFDTPLSLIEMERIDEALRIAQAFPRIAQRLN